MVHDDHSIQGVSGGRYRCTQPDSTAEGTLVDDLDGATAANKRAQDHRKAQASGYIGTGVGAALTVAGVVFTVPLF